jgi:hypothetical protein
MKTFHKCAMNVFGFRSVQEHTWNHKTQALAAGGIAAIISGSTERTNAMLSGSPLLGTCPAGLTPVKSYYRVATLGALNPLHQRGANSTLSDPRLPVRDC